MQHFSHYDTILSMSLLRPGQYISYRARRFVLSIPWWELWSYWRMGRLAAVGITIRSLNSTSSSSIESSFLTLKYGFTDSGNWALSYGKPSWTVFKSYWYLSSFYATSLRLSRFKSLLSLYRRLRTLDTDTSTEFSAMWSSLVGAYMGALENASAIRCFLPALHMVVKFPYCKSFSFNLCNRGVSISLSVFLSIIDSNGLWSTIILKFFMPRR